jgi:hypothetical protein
MQILRKPQRCVMPGLPVSLTSVVRLPPHGRPVTAASLMPYPVTSLGSGSCSTVRLDHDARILTFESRLIHHKSRRQEWQGASGTASRRPTYISLPCWLETKQIG